MGQGDIIRKHLTGTSDEHSRREELLKALLGAFGRGGAEAVTSELEGHLDHLEGAIDRKLQALDALLS
jgi:hypothetical protein